MLRTDSCVPCLGSDNSYRPELTECGDVRLSRWRIGSGTVRVQTSDVHRFTRIGLPQFAESDLHFGAECASAFGHVTCVANRGDSYEQAGFERADVRVCRGHANGTCGGHWAAAIEQADRSAAASGRLDARRYRCGDDDSGGDGGVPQPEANVDSGFVKRGEVVLVSDKGDLKGSARRLLEAMLSGVCLGGLAGALRCA